MTRRKAAPAEPDDLAAHTEALNANTAVMREVAAKLDYSHELARVLDDTIELFRVDFQWAVRNQGGLPRTIHVERMSKTGEPLPGEDLQCAHCDKTTKGLANALRAGWDELCVKDRPEEGYWGTCPCCMAEQNPVRPTTPEHLIPAPGYEPDPVRPTERPRNPEPRFRQEDDEPKQSTLFS